jgi:chromosome segregation ATPase
MKKNIALVILSVLCVLSLFWGRTKIDDYKKERKSYIENVKKLQTKIDSIEIQSSILEKEYIKYHEAYKKDSATIDSLHSVYNNQKNDIVKAENKANLYLEKYKDLKEKIKSNGSIKVYNSKDDLLHSLGKKLK